jgi:hypothetical protein
LRYFTLKLLPEAGTMGEVFRRIDSLLERYALASRRRNAAVA